ncbi:unnamed protein product [Symbiodinium sp. CCMP2592]|nr:unnamed protein product [Symbiodinium sp. CCMP2592]
MTRISSTMLKAPNSTACFVVAAWARDLSVWVSGTEDLLAMGATGSCCSCEDDLQGSDDSRRPGRQTRKRSPTEFTIVIDRRTGDSLGIDAAPEKVGTLEIKSVTPGGLVDRWNQAQPPGSREVVKPGMRVVEVNGRFNSAVGIIAACREAEVLHMSLEP